MAGVTLDARVVIALTTTDDAHHAWAVRLIDGASQDDMSISALTLAESLVGSARAGRAYDMHHELNIAGVRTVPLPAEAAIEIAHLRASSGLRMPDAVVLHTAITQGAALATTDRALATAARAAGIVCHSPAD